MSFFPTDIGCDRKRSDRRGVTITGLLVEIRQHDVGALFREPRAQRKPNAARATGNHGHLVVDVHRWSFQDATATARQGWRSRLRFAPVNTPVPIPGADQATLVSLRHPSIQAAVSRWRNCRRGCRRQLDPESPRCTASDRKGPAMDVASLRTGYATPSHDPRNRAWPAHAPRRPGPAPMS